MMIFGPYLSTGRCYLSDKILFTAYCTQPEAMRFGFFLQGIADRIAHFTDKTLQP